MHRFASARHLASMTLVAFLMNALLPFFAIYNLQALDTSAEARQSLFGDKVLICTETGFQWVAWADLRDGASHPKPHANYKCALCYVAAHGLKDTAPAADVAHEHATYARFASYTEANPLLHASRTYSPRHSRAPPLSFRT